jgi:hypothetical protein
VGIGNGKMGGNVSMSCQFQRTASLFRTWPPESWSPFSPTSVS